MFTPIITSSHPSTSPDITMVDVAGECGSTSCPMELELELIPRPAAAKAPGDADEMDVAALLDALLDGLEHHCAIAPTPSPSNTKMEVEVEGDVEMWDVGLLCENAVCEKLMELELGFEEEMEWVGGRC
jgi:hypothetical protein